MSTRHLFPELDGLVNKCLRGLVSYNQDLAFDETNRMVYDTTFDKSKVALISGGGSGHEPGWAGYVGKNMLAAAAQGDVFASPSTKQIVAGIEAVPSSEGCILVVTNYTGDCLHFGLAVQKANSRGHKCRMIICGDDVSVGKTGSMVGRRGLAGQVGVLKVMGGASGAGGSLDQVFDLGMAFSQQIVSIACTLDHCHVPGRAEHAMLKDNQIELGTGPHNEPGRFLLSPIPTAAELVDQILTYCLKEDDPIRGYVKFAPDDEAMLLVSNFGGISHLEMGALLDELLVQLEKKWTICPVRVACGFLETSLNAPAFSVSVVNVTAAAKNCSYSADEIKGFFDARTNTSWESMTGYQSGPRKPRSAQFPAAPVVPPHTIDPAKDLRIDPATLDKMCRHACQKLAASEPDLTMWDTVMGDGDCGFTLKAGANFLIEALDAGATKDGSVIQVLHELEDIVEGKLGGTLGGILGIFFVALRNGLEENIAVARGGDIPKLWGIALNHAIVSLRQFTPAKVGDRTVMDTLIPFSESMGQTAKFDQGVAAAEQGAEGTKNLKPKLGRATYVGGEDSSAGIPDPGAMGAAIVIKGLLEALQ